VIFGLDVLLDEMQAGAFLGSEAGGLDNLGDQELRLQEMLQLGNVLHTPHYSKPSTVIQSVPSDCRVAALCEVIHFSNLPFLAVFLRWLVYR
jgi:hypothetical protein